MLPLAGYTDRLSAPAGGTIAFKISSTFSEPYNVDLVRIVHGDPNPAGPGMKLIEVDSDLAGEYPSRYQSVRLGSYARVADGPAWHGLGDLSVGATVWPTRPDLQSAIVSKLDETAGTGFSLEFGPEGAVVKIGLGSGKIAKAATGKAPRRWAWYRVWAALDTTKGTLTVHQRPITPSIKADDAGEATVSLPGAPVTDNDRNLLIAAEPGGLPTRHFNGKIERPFAAGRALDADAVDAAGAGGVPEGVIAAWDFSREVPTQTIVDAGPNSLDGVLVNVPNRGMIGANWSGREMCWRHAPEEYGAIHFHDDDLYDCGWETDFTFTVPAGMRSGLYGARLRCQDTWEIVPFYVRPKTGTKTAEVCFLASTFTYQVYANHKRGIYDEPFRNRVRQWGAYPHNADDHPDYAHSTYNYHTDGSGVSMSSRFRPVMTMRPGYLTFNDPRGSGLRHFPADTHLLDWMTAKGHAFDIVTDEDLDDEGVDLIAPYKVVITGSHPEYHTRGTLDALEEFTHRRGGRLMYMGGNGFYWKVARHPDLPGMIEIRRAEGGIRAWAAEPGEYYNQLDGEYGGLWRRNGRPPQRLAGVGFSSQGFFEGSYYRKTHAADDPAVAWIMDGVDEEILGNFGLSGGGAAGFELDRADIRLGTPEHATVVASSENHQESFIAVLEEQLSQRATVAGEPHNRLIRADMTYFETANGGAVFATGSITFCGSLSHDGYDNPISKIIDNVLTRFQA